MKCGKEKDCISGVILMYKVYHGTNENKILLNICETEEDIIKCKCEFLSKIGFKSYYSRNWIDEDGFAVTDYGSHTKFFFVKEVE